MAAVVTDLNNPAIADQRARHRTILAALADGGPATVAEVHERAGGNWSEYVTRGALGVLEYGGMVRAEPGWKYGERKRYEVAPKGLAAIGLA
jgi:hypothetical protein